MHVIQSLAEFSPFGFPQDMVKSFSCLASSQHCQEMHPASQDLMITHVMCDIT